MSDWTAILLIAWTVNRSAGNRTAGAVADVNRNQPLRSYRTNVRKERSKMALNLFGGITDRLKNMPSVAMIGVGVVVGYLLARRFM